MSVLNVQETSILYRGASIYELLNYFKGINLPKTAAEKEEFVEFINLKLSSSDEVLQVEYPSFISTTIDPEKCPFLRDPGVKTTFAVGRNVKGIYLGKGVKISPFSNTEGEILAAPKQKCTVLSIAYDRVHDRIDLEVVLGDL